jgi:hypothetical protein
MEGKDKKEEKKDFMYENYQQRQNMVKTLNTNVWHLPLEHRYLVDAIQIVKRQQDMEGMFPLTWELYNMLLGVIKQLRQDDPSAGLFVIKTYDMRVLAFCIDLGANSDNRLFKIYSFSTDLIEVKLGSLNPYSFFTDDFYPNQLKDYVQRWMITT